MEELKGTIIFKMANVGSKSENLNPFLYQNKESCIPVWRKGDNPFENKGFDEFDGKFVIVKGGRSKTKFVVESIELFAEQKSDEQKTDEQKSDEQKSDEQKSDADQ